MFFESLAFAKGYHKQCVFIGTGKKSALLVISLSKSKTYHLLGLFKALQTLVICKRTITQVFFGTGKKGALVRLCCAVGAYHAIAFAGWTAQEGKGTTKAQSKS